MLKSVQIFLKGIDNDIYSTVDACPNACEIWKSIERLKRIEQDDDISLSENQCHVTNHQVNVQFLLQLQPEWQRFVTLVKQSQELKTVSYYHKLYDILKQHQNEVNDIRAERLAHREKKIVTSSAPTYDPEPVTVTEDDEMSKEKEIDKLMALISLSFKKIYKPTNNNLRILHKHSRANQDISLRINRGKPGYDNQRAVMLLGLGKKCRYSSSAEVLGFSSYNCKRNLGMSRGMNKLIGKMIMLMSLNDQDWKHDYRINVDLEKFHLCLNEEMVADLRYFNSLEHEVDTLKSQLETQKTQFLNEIDRLSREYYYADHMNAILGVYTDLDEVTNLQCDYLETVEKCEHLEKELSKSRKMSKSFEALQKHAINLELDLQQCKEKIKNDKSFKENQSNVFMKEREQYFEIQDLKAQLQDKGIAISELKKLIDKIKGKYVETKFEKSSVIRQPNAFKSQRQSILGKPAIFSDSLAKKDFSKSKPVTIQNVSHDFSKPVTA
ncbi:hypothetical protein Tco_0701111 [Tanacetum coccineum]